VPDESVDCAVTRRKEAKNRWGQMLVCQSLFLNVVNFDRHLRNPEEDLNLARSNARDHVEQIAIASDPMNSGDVGWLVGELRPPT
jgi:hypothetical protein